MCGIVGAVAQRDVSGILLEGLRRLEYRGYDSAGIAVVNANHELKRIRSLGKVKDLVAKVEQDSIPGGLGIAHTRWATHGKPSVNNAHPRDGFNRLLRAATQPRKTAFLPQRIRYRRYADTFDKKSG